MVTGQFSPAPLNESAPAEILSADEGLDRGSWQCPNNALNLSLTYLTR